MIDGYLRGTGIPLLWWGRGVSWRGQKFRVGPGPLQHSNSSGPFLCPSFVQIDSLHPLNIRDKVRGVLFLNKYILVVPLVLWKASCCEIYIFCIK